MDEMNVGCFDLRYSCFGDAVESQAKIKGDATAFRFLSSENQETSITYEEISTKAKKIAAGLQQYCQKGDRALLIFNPGLELIEAFLGCLYAGVIAVLHYPPTNPKLAQKLEKIIKSSEPKVLLTTANLEPKLKDYHIPSIFEWVLLENILKVPASSWQVPKLTLNDIGFLQYTSGSTGDPKGVMVSHGNMLHNTAISRDAYGVLKENACVVSWLPPYHDMGLIGSILTPLVSGTTGVLMAPMTFMMHPIKWLKTIQAYQGTISGGPNFAYNYCVERISEQDKKGLDLSTWDCAFNGAEPIHAETLERFYQAFREYGFRREALFPCYGLAETTLFVAGSSLMQGPTLHSISTAGLQERKILPPQNEADTYLFVSSGQPNLDLVIVDTATHKPLQDDGIGEIWIHGESVAKGYWNLPNETMETFNARLPDDPKQYLRTGDLGFMKDGELYVTGRIKDVIIVHGRNYYPQDIEYATQQSHSLIKPAGCVAFSFKDGDEEAICIVAEIQDKGKETYPQIVQAIRKEVLEELELYASRVILIPSRGLPKTTSGKVQRRKTKRLLEEGQLLLLFDDHKRISLINEEYSNLLDKVVATDPSQREAIFKEIIKKSLQKIMQLEDGQEIDEHQNFFEMGLDSLMAVGLLCQIEKHLGSKNLITNDVLLENATISELTAHLLRVFTTDTLLQAPAKKLDNSLTDFQQLPSYLDLQRQRHYLRELGIDQLFLQEGDGLSSNKISVNNREYINYSSYNYLGFSGDSRVIEGAKQAIDKYGTSVSASRLVSGNKLLHTALEQEIASFIGTEACVVFSAGHATNINTITHLMGPNDVIFYDSLCHNSLIQGAVFSNAARFAFNHNDPAHLNALLEQHRSNFERALILTEGVYSMDGDIPDIPALIQLKKQYYCWLMVDEAHSIGTIGVTGRGVCEYFGIAPQEIDILMGTLSKSFASCGGYVAGHHALIENLKYKAAGFVFSAGISPANTAAALHAIKVLKKEPWRIEQLQKNSSMLLHGMKQHHANTGFSQGTPVIPVIMDSEDETIRLSLALRQDQILAMPILYPAVPRHLSRVRFFVSSTHTPEEIQRTIDSVANILKGINS